jgi:hypothetical protein
LAFTFTPTFTKEKDYLKNRLESISRYKTKDEKNVLLLDDEEYDLRVHLKTLYPDGIEPINDGEASAFIYKAREISVSDVIEMVLECSMCNTINDVTVDLTEIINTDIEVPDYPDFPIGLFETVEDIMSPEDSDNLVLWENNKILKIIRDNNEKIIDPTMLFECRKKTCKHINKISISPLGILSKVTLTGLYNEIYTLMFHAGTTFEDVENLYPFERSLYIQIAQRSLDAKAQNPGLQGLMG